MVACKSIHCVLHLSSIAEYVLSTPVFWKPDMHTRSVRHDWVCVKPNANRPPLVMNICHASSVIQNRRQADGPPDLASLSLSSLAADIISIVDQHYQTASIDYPHTYFLTRILLDYDFSCLNFESILPDRPDLYIHTKLRSTIIGQCRRNSGLHV